MCSDHASGGILRRCIGALCVGALCIAFAVLSVSPAGAAPAGISFRSAALEDTDRHLSAEQALKTLRSGGAVAFPSGRFNRGNRESHYWLLLTVENTGEQSQTVLLDTGVPFRAGLEVWRVGTDGAMGQSGELLLQTGDKGGFAQRESEALTLHTRAFTVRAGDVAQLLLSYTTRGATYMPMSVKSPQTFHAEQREQNLWAVFFYTVCGALLLVFIVLGVVLKVYPILLYCGLFGLTMLFLVAVEGYGFKYIWPHAPWWNQYAALVLLLSTIGMSFFVARRAMDPDSLSPWLSRTLVLLGCFALMLAAASTTLAFSTVVAVTSVLMLLAYIAHLLTIASWMKHAVRLHLFSMASILIALPGIVSLTAVSLLDFDLPDLVFLYGNRAMFLFGVVITITSLCIYVLTLRRAHDQSLVDALEAAQRDAQLSQALLESEQNYARAKELAAQSRQQLASTSHDIRQPLTAIRATISTLALEQGTPERENMDRALDYIEQLSRQSVDQGAPVDLVDQPPEQRTEPYRADLLLSTLVRMFEGEANQKRIVLRLVPCSVLVQESPLVLMRILSNFTANAIKHCTGGAVLLGCRRKGGNLRFDIIDNGPGMDESTLTYVKQAYHKGEGSSGEGLGLAICWQLAQDHGLSIEAQSRLGHGSRFSIEVPRY